MPLIKCPACGKDVSTQATSCPNCGHPVASGGDKPQKKSPLGVVLATLLGLVVIAIILNPANQPRSTSTTTAPDNPCRSDWTKCASNEDLVNHYSGWLRIGRECKDAANDRAKYGNPEWPWFAFGSFYNGNNYITSGTAIAVEPDAQFSNGFGGMAHSRVTCTYDLRAQRVTDVLVSPR